MIVGVSELKTKFGVEGKVVGVELKSVSGKSRGTAVVRFESVEEEVYVCIRHKKDDLVCYVDGFMRRRKVGGIINYIFTHLPLCLGWMLLG